MGERKEKNQKFFIEHPKCCFCGGKNEAETLDHQPARVFFRGREWPENFVFPACRQCNDISRESERLTSALFHGEAGSSDRTAYRKHVASIGAAYPDLIPGMLPSSANEMRSLLRKNRIERPEGVELRKVPLVKIDPTFWQPHFEMISRKILLALHYQCFGIALPSTGAMWAFQSTNVQLHRMEYPMELFEAADQIVIPVRNRRPLTTQFAVRYNVVPGQNAGIFLALIHNRFLISGITTDDLNGFPAIEGPETIRPFRWP
ncbi:MAG: hypothetical protein V4574_04150 [Pseudomonadota bacterium]